MYCLVVTDDYSRFTWVFFQATKDENSGILKSFITGIENLVDHKVKVIRCDNATEFKNREMNQFCEMKGILRQFSVDRNPQQNEVAERSNRTLIEVARTMLADSKFSESTPNVVDSRPDWLFDIDALTKTMNYEPIVAGTSSNGFAGTKASVNAGQATKETEPVKNYILLPLWTVDPPFSQDPKSSYDDGSKPSINNGKKVDEDPKKENEYNELPFDPNIPSLEDVSIFNFLSDNDDGIVADMNNLDTTIQVSPILTTRIHKDHPLDQVIGDLQSATQRRNMSKNLEEHGFVSTIQQRTNHKDLQKCLFACFLSQEEPKKVIHALKDPSWIKAMQKEKIEEEVYVCTPPGFKDPNFPDRVYKVKKVLYGLHQAPRAWYETLSTYLFDNEFQRGKIDKTLFIKRHKGDNLLVQVYVDDIIFGSTKKELCFAFEKSQDYKHTYGNLKPLLKDEDSEEVDVHMYRSMIGSLMYLTSLRPDIMFVVCACARYQVNPNVSHLYVMKRIFRYLKVQPNLGLWYPKDSPFDLVAYTDSDYVVANLDRKSTTGGCQFLECRLKSWQCKKQTVVANSTTKAEYVAASNGKEIVITESSVRRDIQLVDEEGIDCLPNSTIFQQLAYMGKPTRKDTKVPQLSGLTESVADKAVHKELGNSLVRAATAASNLGAECQETIRDTIAQTRFERVSKHSNDSLLARGNTLQSDEDSLKINELMALCTNLQNRVLDLEKTKTTQRNKIESLKRRVKKLEKRNRLRTHKLKRLYKVGLSASVESSGDEESLGNDASKQERRIDAIDVDDEITLVNDPDNEMFDVDALGGEEVFVARQHENIVEEIVDAVQVSIAATTVTITTKEITLAQALKALKTSKPKVKRIVFQEPCKSTTTIISSQQSQDKGKGIMIKEPVKPKKKDGIRLYEEAALKLQAEFDKEERLVRKRAKKEQEVNIALIKTWDDIQAKIVVDHQLAKRLVNTFEDFRPELVERKEKRAGEKLEQEITKKQNMEDDKEKVELKMLMETILDEEEVAIDAIPLAVKSLRIVDWNIHKEGKKRYYQIVRADRKSQMYMFFSQMLKSFNKEDLEDLYKLVKARYGSTRPVENMDYLLWSDMKIVFEPHVEDEIWKMQQGYKVLEWKLYDSCGVHSLIMRSMKIYMFEEKKYPLTPPTLSMMLEKKLQIDYESEMAYQLCKLIKK
nr:hypothetical protein [Tanacetum cinerariifolium]